MGPQEGASAPGVSHFSFYSNPLKEISDGIEEWKREKAIDFIVHVEILHVELYVFVSVPCARNSLSFLKDDVSSVV